MIEGKTKRENRGFLIVLAVVAIALVGLWFYWFEYKPVSIRRYCYQTTYGKLSEQIKSNKDGDRGWKPGKEWMPNPLIKDGGDDWGWWYPIIGVDARYIRCFLERGMKPEKPLSEILEKAEF